MTSNGWGKHSRGSPAAVVALAPPVAAEAVGVGATLAALSPALWRHPAAAPVEAAALRLATTAAARGATPVRKRSTSRPRADGFLNGRIGGFRAANDGPLADALAVAALKAAQRARGPLPTAAISSGLPAPHGLAASRDVAAASAASALAAPLLGRGAAARNERPQATSGELSDAAPAAAGVAATTTELDSWDALLPDELRLCDGAFDATGAVWGSAAPLAQAALVPPRDSNGGKPRNSPTPATPESLMEGAHRLQQQQQQQQRILGAELAIPPAPARTPGRLPASGQRPLRDRPTVAVVAASAPQGFGPSPLSSDALRTRLRQLFTLGAVGDLAAAHAQPQPQQPGADDSAGAGDSAAHGGRGLSSLMWAQRPAPHGGGSRYSCASTVGSVVREVAAAVHAHHRRAASGSHAASDGAQQSAPQPPPTERWPRDASASALAPGPRPGNPAEPGCSSRGAGRAAAGQRTAATRPQVDGAADVDAAGGDDAFVNEQGSLGRLSSDSFGSHATSNSLSTSPSWLGYGHFFGAQQRPGQPQLRGFPNRFVPLPPFPPPQVRKL